MSCYSRILCLWAQLILKLFEGLCTRVGRVFQNPEGYCVENTSRYSQSFVDGTHTWISKLVALERLGKLERLRFDIGLKVRQQRDGGASESMSTNSFSVCLSVCNGSKMRTGASLSCQNWTACPQSFSACEIRVQSSIFVTVSMIMIKTTTVWCMLVTGSVRTNVDCAAGR